MIITKKVRRFIDEYLVDTNGAQAAIRADARDSDLLWEIKRLHGLLREDKRDIELIRREWQEAVGGRLAAIDSMRVRLRNAPGASEINGKP
ncbi:MAG: hypothetical protein JWP38_2984 [Herbaspirillum sp.]|jgi:hypothetical protein|nr:hypothetical protein [Herbaspirillum sp.]